MISILNAQTADIPVICEITAQVWPKTYISIIGETQVAYMLDLFYAPAALQRQMEQGHRFIICYNAGRPAAFASWSETEHGVFKLHKIYVLPGMHGQGIGKALITYIVDEIKKAGASRLRLNVNRYNHPAIAFYKKTGFKHYKDEDIDIGNGYFMNDHVLELPVL